jgi:hypothetical protein
MDVAKRREVFDTINEGVPNRATRSRLAREFKTLAEKFAAAPDADKPKVEAELAELEKVTAIAALAGGDGSRYLYGLIAVVVLLSFASLWAYFGGVGAEKYVLIETTRPVLVFTLIIAMLGFGGTLILSPIFTTQPADDFEKRFRLAREIFLVYSGIFGTIIGFYFGAASSEAAAGQISLGTPIIRQSGAVTVSPEGGTAPYTGTIRLRGEEEDRALVPSGGDLSIQLNRSEHCPAGALVKVGDSHARTAQRTVEQTAASLLTLGWTGCADEAAADAASETVNVTAEPPGNALVPAPAPTAADNGVNGQ